MYMYTSIGDENRGSTRSQVVGRLVEEQYVRLRHGQRGEHHPRLLPSGQLPDRNQVPGAVEPELPQHLRVIDKSKRGITDGFALVASK